MLVTSPALGGETFGDQRFFVGDLHAHTGASVDGGSSDRGHSCDSPEPGACFAIADMHVTARDNGLDFWAITDHINGDQAATEELYDELLDNMLASNVDEEYVTIPGGEMWFDLGMSIGHKTLLMMGSNEDLTGLHMAGMQMDGLGKDLDNCDDLWDYTEALEARWGEILLIPHHPGLEKGMATDWTCHEDSDRGDWYSPAVEIYSNHGNSEHHETHFDQVWTPYSPGSTAAAAIDPEQHKLKLGFIAGTDRHDTRPGETCATDPEHTTHPYGGGLTIVALDEGERFDRGAIFQAIQDRRSYATSGPMVPVRVTYLQGDVRIGAMGDDLILDVAQPLEVRVEVPEEWQPYVITVDLVTPDDHEGAGYMVDMGDHWVGELPAAEFEGYVYPRLILDGLSYYEDGCDDGGTDAREQIWVSPSYLTLVTNTGSEEEGAPQGDCGELGGCDGRMADPAANDAGATIVHDDADPLMPEVVEAGCNSAPASAWLALAAAPTLRRRRGRRD